MGQFLEDYKKRGLFAQVNHEEELSEYLKTPRTAYIGFDPTATSLHAGSLLQILNLKRWQDAGNRAIILIGGGTGAIGDPTGKTELRKKLSMDDLQKNIDGISKQLASYLDLSTPEKGLIVNNAEWLFDIKYIDFLRDFGRHFSVNKMLAAECYKARMESGLSFLEFNYMLLQSYDFYHLQKHYDCSVQLGGDDQWSNMLAGTDLIRRLSRTQAFCITSPLLLTSDGRKMGKTEKGAVWLDPNMTSPYDFFQYWRNTDDADVGKCLNFLTFLDHKKIEELSQLKGQDLNKAKEVLAFEVTKIVHGEEEAKKVMDQVKSVFSGGGQDQAPEKEVSQSALEGDEVNLVDLLVLAKIFASKGEGKRLIKQGGLYVNDERVNSMDQQVAIADLKSDNPFIVRKGKKNYFRVVLGA